MQVSQRLITELAAPVIRHSTAVCLVGLSLAAGPLFAQTDCSEPESLNWLVGEWSVEGHDNYRMSWSETGSENAFETELKPYLNGRGQLPVEVSYEVQVAGEDIYFSQMEASGASRNILSRCTQDYWFFGDEGGYLIARSGEDLLALMRVPSDDERANAPAGILIFAQGVHLVRREVDGAGIQVPLEPNSERERQRRLLRNTIFEAASSDP